MPLIQFTKSPRAKDGGVQEGSVEAGADLAPDAFVFPDTESDKGLLCAATGTDFVGVELVLTAAEFPAHYKPKRSCSLQSLLFTSF